MKTTVLAWILVLGCAWPAAATVRTVTDCGDSNGPGQLRTAVAAAANGDTITIGPCAITLTLGMPLTINVNLTITGAGAALTAIDGNNATSILNIDAGSVAISDVTLRHGSVAVGFGGAIRVNGGSLVLTRSVVADSAVGAGLGGGIYVGGSQALTLVDSTVSGNFGDFVGGGIFANGPLTLINSTVSGNSAFLGAGIVTGTGAVTLLNSTITGNTATSGTGGISAGLGAITVKNTIVANNTAPSVQNCAGTLTSQGHNLESTNECGFNAAGDLINTDPQLGPLQDNGGPTPTQAPLPGSPAIDAGDSAGCPGADQRGVARPQDGDGDSIAACDIGAVEVAAPLLSISPPTGRYVSTQSFDLVLLIGPLAQAIAAGHVAVDGAEVTGALAPCLVLGRLVVGGFTARCPGLRGSLFAPGTHTVSVTLDLAGGGSVSDTVRWRINPNTEP